MAFTVQEVITSARYAMKDADSGDYRMSDAEGVIYVNDGIAEISIIRPALFKALGDLTCIDGQCDQTVTFTEARELVDVLAIHGGSAVPECDMATLDAFLPSWRTTAAGAAVNWMRKPGDPLRFFIYPKAPADQVLDVMYVKNPTALALSDPIQIVPATMRSALVHYVVWRAEFKDDEHVNSGRAKASYEVFVELVKGAAA